MNFAIQKSHSKFSMTRVSIDTRCSSTGSVLPLGLEGLAHRGFVRSFHVKLTRQISPRAAPGCTGPHFLSFFSSCTFTVLFSFPRATGNEQITGEFIPALFYSGFCEVCKGT